MQNVLSRSSFEAELNSSHEVEPQVMGNRRFMVARGYFVGTVKVWQNSMPTIAFVKNRKSTSHRAKWHCQLFFIEEKVDEGEIEVEYTTKPQKPAECLLSHYKESSS